MQKETKPLSDKVPRRIPVEITRKRDGTDLAPIVIKKGSVSRSAEWFTWKDGLYRVDPRYLISVQVGKRFKRTKKILRFDVDYAEALDSQYNKTDPSEELENRLIDSSYDQILKAIGLEGFSLTPEQIRLLIIIAIISVPLGLVLNERVTLIPQTIIHWVP